MTIQTYDFGATIRWTDDGMLSTKEEQGIVHNIQECSPQQEGDPDMK